MEWLVTLGRKFDAYFLTAGSMGSIYSFGVALCVAVLYLFLRRKRRNLRLLRVILRKLLAPGLWFSRSSRLDLVLVLVNVLLLPGILFLAVLSYEHIGESVYGTLVRMLGEPPAQHLPGWLCSAIITLGLFVAYEFAYWVDHVLSHKIPILWEFHRVHHSATVLTPFTNWRMHPVDALVFLNLIAVVTGSTQAVTHYALGVTTAPYLIQGENLLFLAYIYLYGHLQHSHVWMTFGGFWSKIFMSPAAHQIHHSTNPAHFDKNFGGAFAFWDWLFGTLHVPIERREVHEVGLSDDRFRDSLFLTMIHPFQGAIDWTARRLPRRADDGRKRH